MTRSISKFGLLLLSAVITLTCSSPLVPVSGTVVLDFSSGSRAVGIPDGLTTFNIEVKAQDMATIEVQLTAPDLSTAIELPAGADRAFHVTAADSAGIIRYQGKAQLEVVPGATHDLDITMSLVLRVNYFATGAGSGLAPVDAGLYSAGDSATVLGNSGNLTKAGYSFAGWNTAEDGSGTTYAVGTALSLADADISLYPRWIPAPYSITYVLNGGVNATGNPATYTIVDADITLLPPEPWSPYTFLGWYTDTNYITEVISISAGSTGNITLYALWDAPTYTVSFDAQGGTTATPPTTTVTYGQTYGALATTSRVGYSFVGWFTETLGAGTQIFETTTVAIAANQTLFAHWVEETYTISYVLNGAPDNGGNPSSYTVSSSFTLTAPTWAPYVFEGWYTDIAYTFGKNEILPGETGDITLYAQWSAPTYTVSYDAQGGTTATPPTTSVTYGQTYGPLANTSQVGYTLVGWFTETLGAGTQIFETTTVTITANQTLYAYWVPMVYPVSFDTQGGTPAAPSMINVTYNQTYGVLPTTSQVGYTFSGWWTGPNGTGVEVIDTTLVNITAPQTLYAYWVPMVYPVSFDAQGGDPAAPSMINVTYNQTYGVLPTTSQVGYTFSGWWTGANGFAPEIFDTTTVTITAPQTLYAFWVPSPYAITYDVGGAPDNGGNPISYTIETPTITLAAPVYGGFTFGGWFSTPTFDVGTEVIEIPMGSTGGITLYAQWL